MWFHRQRRWPCPHPKRGFLPYRFPILDQADEEVMVAQVIHYKKKLDGIVSLLSDLKLKNIGFESLSLTFSFHRSLFEKLTNEVKLIPLEDEIKNLRAVKDSQELTSIRTAIDISSKAFLHVIQILKEGVVEREIALEMESFMKRSGADDTGFDIIIASGKRSALPHGKASEKRITRGDLILIDFGSGLGLSFRSDTHGGLWSALRRTEEDLSSSEGCSR